MPEVWRRLEEGSLEESGGGKVYDTHVTVTKTAQAGQTALRKTSASRSSGFERAAGCLGCPLGPPPLSPHH